MFLPVSTGRLPPPGTHTHTHSVLHSPSISPLSPPSPWHPPPSCHDFRPTLSFFPTARGGSFLLLLPTLSQMTRDLRLARRILSLRAAARCVVIWLSGIYFNYNSFGSGRVCSACRILLIILIIIIVIIVITLLRRFGSWQCKPDMCSLTYACWTYCTPLCGGEVSAMQVSTPRAQRLA